MKNKINTLFIAMIAVMLSGCGESQKENIPAPAPQTNQIMNQLGVNSMQSPFTQRQEGMFDGIGREDLRNAQPGQVQVTMPFPQYRHWHTRIEFLKDDGNALDPNSLIGMPKDVRRVRITLISDAAGAPATQYMAAGYVYVMSTDGYALLNYPWAVPLRAVNPAAQNTMVPLFEMYMGDGFGKQGPMLGLQWSAFRGSLFGGTIVLQDATGKHVIQY